MKATNLKTYEDVPHLYTPTSGSPASTELTRRMTVVLGTVNAKGLALPSVRGKRKHFTVLNLNSNTIAVTCAAANGTITNCADVGQSTMNIARYKGYTFEAIAGVWYVTGTIVSAAT